jgi:hypothetical protein
MIPYFLAMLSQVSPVGCVLAMDWNNFSVEPNLPRALRCHFLQLIEVPVAVGPGIPAEVDDRVGAVDPVVGVRGLDVLVTTIDCLFDSLRARTHTARDLLFAKSAYSPEQSGLIHGFNE